jgi:hypothetical protein
MLYNSYYELGRSTELEPASFSVLGSKVLFRGASARVLSGAEEKVKRYLRETRGTSGRFYLRQRCLRIGGGT